MYSYSIISPQARTASTRGISTIRRSFRETQGRFIWPPTSEACQKESTTSKDLDRKNEIGPVYAPYREGNRSVTTTKQQKEKKIFRNEKEGPSSRQEELSETKRREDPPKTRAPRGPFRSEASSARKTLKPNENLRAEPSQLEGKLPGGPKARLTGSKRRGTL